MKRYRKVKSTHMVTKGVSSRKTTTTGLRMPSTSIFAVIAASWVVRKTVALPESTSSTGATSMTER